MNGTEEKPLTIRDLLSFLKEMVEHNPLSLNSRLATYDNGGHVEYSTQVSLEGLGDDERIVFY